MTSYEQSIHDFDQYISDLKNGIIKAFEVWDYPLEDKDTYDEAFKQYCDIYDKREFNGDIGHSVLRNNVHALTYRVPMLVEVVNDEGYALKYYSRDKHCFLSNDFVKWTDELKYKSYLEANPFDYFRYDGDTITQKSVLNPGTVNESCNVVITKVHKELTYFFYDELQNGLVI